MYYKSQYSHGFKKYFVAKVEGKEIELIWACISEVKSIKFASALNSGTVVMCRGCKILGTACGHCMKCECT